MNEPRDRSFDLQPNLEGATLLLRPIVRDDFERIYAIASDPLVWEQHPSRDRWQPGVFEKWFEVALVQGALIVEERQSGRVIGSSRYYHWQPKVREVSIGYTFLARDHWGGATNRELKSLMLNHAFRWAERVWFHVNPSNTRSRKAMKKIGAIEDRTTEFSINGEKAVTYVFYIVDREDRNGKPLSDRQRP